MSTVQDSVSQAPAVTAPSKKSMTVGSTATLVVLALLLITPLFVKNFIIFQMTMVLIYAVAILSLNILTGGSGRIDPAVLAVCRKLGVEHVFRVNGPAGVAALGFGTDTIPQVRKIVGPGSPPVACAQVEMQRYGVATMMILGPTESMVIADDSADPRLAAADLLNEAEHGTDSTVLLVTTSGVFADAVDRELGQQLAQLPAARAEAARAALGRNGGCVMVADLAEAAEVANRWAPEHLQVVVAPDAEGELLDLLVNAGEILVGQSTLFSAGNFVIGCPASLPTGGFAHVSSGITADTFLKRAAVARADAAALARMAATILAMAAHEGFPAHANAAVIRQPGR